MPSPRTLAELRKIALDAGLAAAAFHRRRLKDVSFIGVTGSCGKTTTKELIAAVLGATLAGRKSPGTSNSLTTVGKTVLRTTASDAFCVVEIAAWEPGSVARAARVVAPNIAVVTNIGADHRQAFRTLELAADALAAVEPPPARMSPVVLNGVTFIRDDVKAPMWTMDAAFAFLAQARVARKLAVIGTISDYFGSTSRAYRRAAEGALAVADEVLFVGPNARRALNARGDGLPLHAFETVDVAVEHLRANLRRHDLVLVKGSETDRLARILQAAIG